VPVPSARGYLLLQAPQDDIADYDLCNAKNGEVLSIRKNWHNPLFRGFTGMSVVPLGDTVRRHSDHTDALELVADHKGWGNVMYMPATANCHENTAHARLCGETFRSGKSPSDFAPEDCEVRREAGLLPQTSTAWADANWRWSGARNDAGE
jgi:hypothetical protein